MGIDFVRVLYGRRHRLPNVFVRFSELFLAMTAIVDHEAVGRK